MRERVSKEQASCLLHSCQEILDHTLQRLMEGSKEVKVHTALTATQITASACVDDITQAMIFGKLTLAVQQKGSNRRDRHILRCCRGITGQHRNSARMRISTE